MAARLPHACAVRDTLQAWGWWPLAALSFNATLLMAVGAPPQGTTWLIWLGFIPLTLVARVSRQRSRRSVFLLGWVGGLCTGLVGFPWIAETLERFGGLPWPVALFGLLLFSAWTAVPFGLWTFGVSRGPERGFSAVAWPAVLWAALAFVWPSFFPYTVVIGFAEAPQWIQLAELGGVSLVVAQVVLVGVLLADAILGGSRRARIARVLGAAAIPLLSTGLGNLRLSQVDEMQAAAPTVRFGIVQPNVALGSFDDLDKMNRLRLMSLTAKNDGAQVVVWPEAGAFPFRTRRPFTEDFSDPFRSVLLGHRLPTIFGAGSYDSQSPWERNTVYSMGVDGKVRGSFDKVILVPFGEYVPVVDPHWAMSYVPSMSHNLAGSEVTRLPITPVATEASPAPPELMAGPVICYEDIFPGFAHEVATQDGGIDLFVNVTIDTWFGDTAEPWEHLALAQFRSVEHRIPMVRSVSAGVSSVVDAGGRLVAHLPARGPTADNVVPPEVLVYDVALARNTAQHPTIFARFGWLLPWLCVVVVCGVMLAAVRRTAYSRRAKAAETVGGDAPQEDRP